MGTINIIKLKVKTIVGVNKIERIIKQPLYFDIKIDYNSEAAEISDNVQYAVDYFEITKKIKKFVKNNYFYLIEKMCSEVLKIIIQHPSVISATVTVYKPRAIFSAKNISFTLSSKNSSLS